ncbi:4Fe-4S single cluster domain-containing protein [Pseudoramibacter sp.]|jgi:anaerobic ribonucleoside-triphosphate reductase activating protein|uniref:4Fe-4S single cluster domain-containing protein n=1 Tax=Pseudoramibacter sp. TaxID=2034862 RepID=UPI0025D60CF5|nr:4Fe-4S single cluster domain-containing protein [Pseudoramibacter sp.]MCH4072051.1 radical SAM protein [Pseudoramibacter sp.]MCH4105820.1 radical SAM protein [Pseudoramibacter sp.]
MNVYQIICGTKAEGPGKRTAIWMQGCSRHCSGCMLPETWSFVPRTLIAPETVIENVPADNEGITVLGGEPFEQPEALAALLRAAKARGLSTIVFSGYTYGELKALPAVQRRRIFESVDVLIDGAYEKDKRSFAVPMIGSSNQRFYFLSDRYTMADIPANKIEVRIQKDGTPMLSGMGDFEKLVRKLRCEH